MQKLKIMMTGAGAPQSPTLIRQLKGNGEYEIEIVSVDMDGEACGGFFSDAFHVIPPAGGEGYKERLFEILKAEKPDALLNVSGADVRFIAPMKREIEALGITCICSDPEAVEVADNKAKLYALASTLDDVPVPEHCTPASLDEFVEQARAMGYPERDLCFKPHVGKGTRGFRILTERFDKRDLLLNHKPTARYMGLDEFISVFNDDRPFPELLLMEVAEGEEIDAMTIAYKGEALLTTCKTRESHRWGVIDKAQHVYRPDIEKSIAALCAATPLGFNISIQFIDGKLIEINPRTSTFIYQDDMSEPWLAVKLALGLITAEEVKAAYGNIDYDRRMVRYMDQLFFHPDRTWYQ